MEESLSAAFGNVIKEMQARGHNARANSLRHTHDRGLRVIYRSRVCARAQERINALCAERDRRLVQREGGGGSRFR